MFRLLNVFVPLTTAMVVASGSARARTLVVHPVDSIRSAVDQASPGDTILVQPGVYHEGASGDLNAVTITKPGLQVIGLSTPSQPVVLENAGGQSFGFWVSPSDSAGAGPE